MQSLPVIPDAPRAGSEEPLADRDRGMRALSVSGGRGRSCCGDAAGGCGGGAEAGALLRRRVSAAFASAFDPGLERRPAAPGGSLDLRGPHNRIPAEQR